MEPSSTASGHDLYRLVQGSREGGMSTTLTLVRHLSVDDYASFKQARRRGAAFGPSWVYNRLLGDIESFESLTVEALATTKRAKSVNPTDETRLSRALAEILIDAEKLLAEAHDDDGRLAAVGMTTLAGEHKRKALELFPIFEAASVFAEIRGRNLCRIHVLDDVAFSADIMLTHEASTRLRTPQGALVEARSLIEAIKPAATYLAAELLTRNRAILVEATSRLALLRAEVTYGNAIIVPTKNAETKFEDMSYENADPSQAQRVMYAIDRSEQFLRTFASTVAASSPEDDAPAPPRESAPPGNGTDSAEQVVDSSTVENQKETRPDRIGDERGSAGKDADADSKPLEGGSADQGAGEPPIDLTALAQEVRTLSEETERSWSAALASQLAADNRRLAERAGSLVAGVYRQVEKNERELQAEGDSVVIPSFPLQVGHVDILRGADRTAVRVQTALATIYSLQRILKSVEDLQRPSATRVELPSGRFTSWWEGGAFARLRSAALSLTSLQHQQAIEDADRNWGQAMFFAEQMALSLENNLAEASLVYAKQALTVMHEIDIQLTPGEGEDVQHLQGALDLLDDVSRSLSAGDYVPRRIALPLANIFVRVISQSLQNEMNNSLARFRAQSKPGEQS